VLFAVFRPTAADRKLRWTAFGLTLAVAGALAPATVADSGGAAVFLLGVPVMLAALPVAADRFGRAVIVAEAVAACGTIGWGLLLGLGIGAAFLPIGLLLVALLVVDLSPRGAGRPHVDNAQG
jgi:hypothetical protein